MLNRLTELVHLLVNVPAVLQTRIETVPLRSGQSLRKLNVDRRSVTPELFRKRTFVFYEIASRVHEERTLNLQEYWVRISR